MTERNYPLREDLPYVESPKRWISFWVHPEHKCYGITKSEMWAHCNTLALYIRYGSRFVNSDGSDMEGHYIKDRVLAWRHREVYETSEEVYNWMESELKKQVEIKKEYLKKIGWTEITP